MKTLLFYLFFVFLFNQCTTQASKPVAQDSFKTTHNSILNYEDSALELNEQTIKDYYHLHIEVEKPFVISFKKAKLSPIYKISHISGVVIIKAEIDTAGNITHFKLVKKAGLGLDEIVVSLLKKVKLTTLYHIDKSYSTSFYLRFVFKRNAM